MRKLILIAALAGFSFPVLSGVVVDGKAPLSLGVDKAREEAVTLALLDASYRNNAYVSGVTKLNDLAIEESRALIKTSSLIETYKIVDEMECGSYYCVSLEVEYGEKLTTVGVGQKTFVLEVLSVDASLTIEQRDFYATVKKSLRQKLNGFNNLAEVDSEDHADYKISVVLQVNDVDRNFFQSWFDDSKTVAGSVVVSTRGDAIAKEFTSESTISMEKYDSSDELYDLTSQLKALSFKIMKSMPLEDNYVVGNIEGKNLFIKSKNLSVGSVFEVVFEDLKARNNVKIIGYVESVFNGDVLVVLKDAPLPSYRLRRLTKIAK